MRHQIIEEDLRQICSFDLPFTKLKNKTVLVTGANGFLPAAMVETMLYLNEINDLNISVIGFVRNLEKAQMRFAHYKSRKDIELIQHDVGTPFQGNIKPDFIIHAASQASPKYYGSDPVGTIAPNVIGTSWLLELARRSDTEQFLFFSSAETYGTQANNSEPINELSYGSLNPLNVRSCYAEAKRMGETMCAAWAAQYGVKFRVVRPFHTYGPGMALDDGRVFCDFVSDIVNRRNIIMKSNGSAKRAYCYLSDAVHAFFCVLLKGEDLHAYNIGNPAAEVSVKELAEILVTLLEDRQLKVEMQLRNDSYIPSQIDRLLPNVDKLLKLGWQPTLSVEAGFKRTILSYL